MKRHISIFTLLLCAFAAAGQDAGYYYVAANVPCKNIIHSGSFGVMNFTQWNQTSGAYYDSTHVSDQNGFTSINLLGKTLTAGTEKGYRFLGWYSHEGGWTSLGDVTVASAEESIASGKTLTDSAVASAGKYRYEAQSIPVVFAKYVKVWTVTAGVDPAGAGTVSLSGTNALGTVDDGGSVTLKAIPTSMTSESGYHFDKWSDGVPDATRTIESVSSNAHFVAGFKANGYNISKTGENVVFDPSSAVGVYDEDMTVSWGPAMEQGYDYKFKSAKVLSGNEVLTNVSAGTSLTFNMKRDCGKFHSPITIEVIYERTAQKPHYQISASVMPSGSGEVAGAGEYEEGSNATLTATNNPGYSFSCWSNDTGIVSMDNPWTFAVAAAATYTAVFTGNTYTVTFYGNGGDPDEQVRAYTHGSAYGEFPGVDRNGHDFVGWFTSAGKSGTRVTEGELFLNVDDYGELFAHWTEKTEFTGTFIDPSGTNKTVVVEGLTKGQPVPANKVPDFRRAGYQFNGWNPALPATVSGDFTTYAQWMSLASVLDCEGTLWFAADDDYSAWAVDSADFKLGGTSLRADGPRSGGSGRLTTSVKEPGTMTFWWKGDTGTILSVKPGNGEEFFGVFTGSDGMGWTSCTITVDRATSVIFYCSETEFSGRCSLDGFTWTPAVPVVTYDVIYDKGSCDGVGGEGRTDEKTNDVNLVLADRLFTRDNHTQEGWSRNADGSSLDFILNGTYAENAAITLYPYWLKKGEYTVSYSAGTGATGSAAEQTAYEGETVVLHGNGHFTRTGYSQDGWTTVDLGTKVFDFDATYKANVSTNLYPCWTNNRYTVTFNPNGGSVTPAPKVVTYDEAYGDLPTLDDREDFKFAGWILASGAAVTAETIVKTAKDHELIAKWENDVGELSRILDCDNLKFVPGSVVGWTKCTDFYHKGDSCLRSTIAEAEVKATITEPGTLTFWWRGFVDDKGMKLQVLKNGTEVDAYVIRTSDSEELNDKWFEGTAVSVTIDIVPVVLTFRSANVGEYCAIDHVTWIPEGAGEPTPGEPVAVTAAGVENGVFALTIPTKSGTDYGVWTNADLTVDSWGLMGEPKPGDGNPWKVEWTILPGFPQLFFRAHKVEYK